MIKTIHLFFITLIMPFFRYASPPLAAIDIIVRLHNNARRAIKYTSAGLWLLAMLVTLDKPLYIINLAWEAGSQSAGLKG